MKDVDTQNWTLTYDRYDPFGSYRRTANLLWLKSWNKDKKQLLY